MLLQSRLASDKAIDNYNITLKINNPITNYAAKVQILATKTLQEGMLYYDKTDRH